MEGLAIAIAVASLAIVVVPAGLGGVLGYVALRKRQGALGALAGALLGGAGGVLGVTATFFEDTWSPPPSLTIEAPPGFAHEWVVFIADPSAGTAITWTGVDAPFTSRRARIAVPASGVLRVRDLGRIDGGGVRARLATGVEATGAVAKPAPPGIGPGRFVAYGFAPYPGREPDLGSLEPGALEALLRAREAER